MTDTLLLTREMAIHRRANLSERRRKRSDASRKGWVGR